MYCDFTYRPDVGIDALRRAQTPATPGFVYQFDGRAELAQQRRLVFVIEESALP